MEEIRQPFHKEIAEKIINQLEKGVAPWQRGWSSVGKPYNFQTGKPYRGANVLNLAIAGFRDPRWMTYRQAQSIGAQVKRGEKGTKVQYWIFEEMQPSLDKDGKPKLDHNGKEILEKVKLERPKVINSVVFNAEQIDGLPSLEKKQVNMWDSVQKAEDILNNSGANIIHKRQDNAYYQPSTDKIVLPEKDQFQAPEFYYGTALHELGHWTGHQSRLNRDLTGSFGSEEYAKEELRAEISSMMIEMEIGIPHDTNRHVSYVQSWIKALKDDPAEIIRASSDAEKIKDFVLSLSQKQEVELQVEQRFNLSEIRVEGEIGTPATLKTLDQLQDWFTKSISEEEINRRSGYAKVYATFIGKNSQGEETSMTDRIDVGKLNADFNPYKEDINKYIEGKLEYYNINTSEVSKTGEVKMNSQSTSIIDKTYISVPFKEKEEAKALGAKWDRQASSWYIPDNLEQSRFSKWLNMDNGSNVKLKPEFIAEKTYLAVPFKDKEEAKSLGVKWDKTAKSWYILGEVTDKVRKWLPENNPSPQDPALSPKEEFANFMRDMGLVVSGEHPIMDGKLHRVRTEQDKSKEFSGAYILHGDGLPAGYAQNFRTGDKQTWKSKGYHISSEDLSRMRAESAQKLQERELAIHRQHEEVSTKISESIGTLSEAKSDQAYLVKKGIQNHKGIFEDKYRNMVIPAYDETGRIWVNQTIYPDGNKRFTAGGKKEGNFHVVGGLEQLNKSNVIIIAEGYATAATITEATNIPVVAAFDSGNLKNVAKKLNQKYPDKPIIIAGDDDMHRTLENKPNVGREKAEEAARSVNGIAIFPIFPSNKIGSKSCTDFNDLARESEYKLEAVANIVKSNIESIKQQRSNYIEQPKAIKAKR